MGTSSSSPNLPLLYSVTNNSSGNITVSDGDNLATVNRGQSVGFAINKLTELPPTVTITTANGKSYRLLYAANIKYIVDDRLVSLMINLSDLSGYYLQGTGGNYAINNQSDQATVNIDDGGVVKVFNRGTFQSFEQGLPGSNWVNVAFNGPAIPVAIFDGMTLVFPADGTPGYALLNNTAANLGSTFPAVKGEFTGTTFPTVKPAAVGGREIKSSTSWWMWLIIIVLVILLIGALYKGDAYKYVSNMMQPSI